MVSTLLGFSICKIVFVLLECNKKLGKVGEVQNVLFGREILIYVKQDLGLMKSQQQRRLEQRPTQPLTPLQRPIILPGGRRWIDPEDASKSIRRPKLTDEKIAGTIESYSEVLIGRTKG